MKILNLFPTDVYIEENTEIDNKKLSKIILEKERTESSRYISNAGGWQSDTNLHTDKRFSEIIENTPKLFLPIFQNYNYSKESEVSLIFWANVNRYRDYNQPHIHTNSDWSFVYYVETSEDMGRLVLIDPRIRKIIHWRSGEGEINANSFTHNTYSVTPLVGKFIIFPSYLEHLVEFNPTDKPRISISGNIKITSKKSS